MKTFLAALGLTSLAGAANPIAGTVLEKALEQVGLVKNPDNIDVKSPFEDKPRVKAFGWDSTLDPTVN